MVSEEQAGPSAVDTAVDTMVDVGGRRLALRQAGTRNPTVILEAGMGCGKESWDQVFAAVSQVTHVCSYDRAGVGASDPAPTPRTGQEVVADLHALLVKAQIPGPYILVGHSFGGLFVRLYAHEHREQVVGMVLVDSSHEDQWSRSLRRLPPETADEPEGLKRWRQIVRERINDLSATKEGILTGASTTQVRATGALGDLPLVVLTAARPTPRPEDVLEDPDAHAEALWWEMRREVQDDFVRLSSRSTQILARASGHFVQADEPEIVIAAIRQVVETVRRRDT